MSVIQQAAEEQIKKVFNFSIDKFPLSGPDGMRTPFYGLFRSDTSEVVHSQSVTQRYQPHTTEDVLGIVEACNTIFPDCKPRCHFSNGHYVELTPSDQHRITVFGTKDSVFPRLLVHAGYDGTPFVVSMGWWRDVCKNLHILRMVDGVSVRLRHATGLRDKVNELIEDLGALSGSWDTIKAQIEAMKNREVNMAEFMKSIYKEPEADSGRGVTMHKNRTEAIFRRLMRERHVLGRGPVGDDFTVSAWEAFNAVQGYVQHDAIRRGGPDSFTRMLASVNDSNVRKAEELALAG